MAMKYRDSVKDQYAIDKDWPPVLRILDYKVGTWLRQYCNEHDIPLQTIEPRVSVPPSIGRRMFDSNDVKTSERTIDSYLLQVPASTESSDDNTIDDDMDVMNEWTQGLVDETDANDNNNDTFDGEIIIDLSPDD